MDIAVADFHGDDVLDIVTVVTAEKGAPNFLYLGLGKTDPTKLGDFSGVAPIPNSNKDGTGVFEYRAKLGDPYDTGPSAVGIDETVDTTGLDCMPAGGLDCCTCQRSTSPRTGTLQPVLASDLTLDGGFKTKQDRAAACPLQWLPVLLAGAPPERSMQMIGRHVHDASAARPLHVKVAVLNAHLEGNLGDEV